eukprot:GHRR01002171.1.p1 GENE.GHRR01002171.1~~GHRR01002171.1.p1  ORF type:complete len:748 (+),score=234.78 GHRR01002171.1:134-2377(+)
MLLSRIVDLAGSMITTSTRWALLLILAALPNSSVSTRIVHSQRQLLAPPVGLRNTLAATAAAVQPDTASSARQSIDTNKALTEWSNLAGGNEDSLLDLIVVFREHGLAERVRPFCSRVRRQQQRLQQFQGVAVSQEGAGRLREYDSSEGTVDATAASASCASLPEACQHVFGTALPGVAGRFNQQQYQALLDCIGKDSIDYIERDGQVLKAEAGDYRDWWRQRPSPGTTIKQLLQHMQQDAAATPLGTRRQQIRQWLLAEVGLSTQQHLANGQPDLVTVQAMDGSKEDQTGSVTTENLHEPIRSAVTSTFTGSISSVTAAEGALGAGSDDSSISVDQAARQPVFGGRTDYKNQDPGIPVDSNAIANPEILATSAGDQVSAASRQTEQPLSQQAAEEANNASGVKVQRLVPALWNLDRIDQRALPLDGTFAYGTDSTAGTGKGVTIYTIDSGILASHQEFQPWATSTNNSSSRGGRAKPGPDFVDEDGFGADCDGHGTHVASTAAGRSVGIAKEANVVAIRVLDCDGAGSISDVVAALDWVAENAVKPAVASLSLGVPSGQWSKAMEAAVQHLVLNVGIPVVVASGNSAEDSCQIAPARVPEAITVAASNLPTKFEGTASGDTEQLYRWSNTGACIDVFAPGVDIYGACGGPSRCSSVTDAAYTWASGTSMAAPHVTGFVAVWLADHPEATPAQVHDAITHSATNGTLSMQLMAEGTPNRSLFTRGPTNTVEAPTAMAADRADVASAG